MSTNKSQIDEKILDRLRKAKKLRSDTDLADYLGVKQNTISTWRRRNSFNLEIIISKCDEEGLNLNWIFYDELPVWKKDIRIREGAAEHKWRIVAEDGEIYTPDNIAEKLKKTNLSTDEKISIIQAYVELQHQKITEEQTPDDEKPES